MATRLLIALAAAIAFLGGGYWWGHTSTDYAWQARQAKADQQVREQMAELTASAGRAAVRLQDQLIEQRERYGNLDAKYRDLRGRHPLIVPGPVVVAQCPSAEPTGLAAGDNQRPDADAVGNSSPRLTFAAVRVWNGALAGVDVPTGACGAAGAPAGADAACADDSGLTLNDAWDNHAINARACAEDRQRYRALIDYLKQTPSGD